jgi:hypothetical protein
MIDVTRIQIQKPKAPTLVTGPPTSKSRPVLLNAATWRMPPTSTQAPATRAIATSHRGKRCEPNMPPEAARIDAPNGTNTMRKIKLAAASKAAIADASTRTLVSQAAASAGPNDTISMVTLTIIAPMAKSMSTEFCPESRNALRRATANRIRPRRTKANHPIPDQPIGRLHRQNPAPTAHGRPEPGA